MSLTLTNADAALKEDYQPAMREQLNNTVQFLAQIERNSKDVEGRRAVLSLHVRRNSGVGARADGGTLPSAGNQGYAEERVSLRFNYGRIQISGPTLRAMKSDEGSFVRALDSETKGVVTDLRRDVNRQLFGTSDGVIIATDVTMASTTVVLGLTAAQVQKRQIEVGMLIDIGIVATPTSVASAREVLSVATDGLTIVISGAPVTTASTDRIFRTGNGGSGSAQKELTGIQSIVDDANALFNVNPSTEPIWKSVVNANGGTNRTPTENVFAKLMHDVAIAGGTDELNLFVTSDGVHRAYASSLSAQKRFPNTLDLKGGYKGLAIAAGNDEVALMWDRDAPSNKAWGLATSHLTQHEMSDWEFMDDDGAVLSRVSGQDAYEATLFKYHELTTDKRNAHGVIEDLLEA